MKLAIVGSKSINDFDISGYIPEDVTLIITGGEKRIDTIAEKYADKNKISKLVLRPQYSLYKRGESLQRNKQMIEIADEILIFWDGKSKETKFYLEFAKKLNKPYYLIIPENDEYQILRSQFTYICEIREHLKKS